LMAESKSRCALPAFSSESRCLRRELSFVGILVLVSRPYGTWAPCPILPCTKVPGYYHAVLRTAEACLFNVKF
jgi:hypothetical protein